VKKIGLIFVLFLITVPGPFSAQAMETRNPKVMSYSVDYPLIRSVGYPSPKGDPYERSFGVRRFLRPIGAEGANYLETLEASHKWHQMFGGYGVLGHGEEVFTSAARRWRHTHRGR